MAEATRGRRVDRKRDEKDEAHGADAVGVRAVRPGEQIEIGRDANGGVGHSRDGDAAAQPRRDRPSEPPSPRAHVLAGSAFHL